MTDDQTHSTLKRPPEKLIAGFGLWQVGDHTIRTYLEKGFSPDTRVLLEQRGHKLQETTSVASVEAILIDSGWLQGAQNGRSAGKAAGY